MVIQFSSQLLDLASMF